MNITEGDYITDNSDLLVRIYKVHYRGDGYIKAVLSLFNKRNNIHYETKNYKIYLKNVTHWKKSIDTS